MQLQKITPLLWVDNVRTTIDYYVSVFGFDEANFSEDPQWGVVEKHYISIMFCRPGENMGYNGPRLTGSLYLRTDDADAWWDFLKDRAEIVYPLEDSSYGMREFAVKDCNGYILQFGQTIPF